MADLWEQAASLTRRIADREEEPEGHAEGVDDGPAGRKEPAKPDLPSPAGFASGAGPVEDSALPSMPSVFDARRPVGDSTEDVFTSFKPVQLDQLQREHPFAKERRASESPQPPPSPGGPSRQLDETPTGEAAELFEEGLSLMREGRYDDAASCWERALSLDPDNRVYVSNLRRLKKLMEPPSGKSPW